MLTIADIMSKNLITLTPSDTIRSARNIMENARIRHLPIITKTGLFAGIVTQRDIIRASVSQLADLQQEEIEAIESAIPLGEIMNRTPLTVSPEMSIKEAATIMLERKFGCLPIVKNDHLVGILTESDFIKLALSLLDNQE